MINVVGRIGYLWGSKHNRIGGCKMFILEDTVGQIKEKGYN